MGLLELRFRRRRVVLLEELWLSGYADQHDRPIFAIRVLVQTSARAFLAKSLTDMEHGSFRDASQGKKRVFICHFVYPESRRLKS